MLLLRLISLPYVDHLLREVTQDVTVKGDLTALCGPSAERVTQDGTAQGDLTALCGPSAEREVTQDGTAQGDLTALCGPSAERGNLGWYC